MTNIFKAYAVVQDKDFVRYIDDLKTQYEDGRLDMDADKLMMLGYQKFKNLNLHNTWQAPPAKDKADIVALLALGEELLALKTTIKGLKGQLGKKEKAGGAEAGKRAWKSVAPSANQAQSKQVNSKTYHWCPNHTMWCIHTPAECKQIKTDSPASSSGTSTVPSTIGTDDDSTVSKRKLQLTNAFHAFVQDADDGDDCI
jgi:hypothetical protein